MFRIEFFVQDKDLGEAFKRLAGIARNLQHAYVPNLEPKSNGKMHVTGNDALELLMKEVRKRGLTTIRGKEFKAIVEKVGLTPASYGYFLKGLLDAGALKRGKKEGTGLNYLVTPEK